MVSNGVPISLITRRSLVQIQPPRPETPGHRLKLVTFFFSSTPRWSRSGPKRQEAPNFHGPHRGQRKRLRPRHRKGQPDQPGFAGRHSRGSAAVARGRCCRCCRSPGHPSFCHLAIDRGASTEPGSGRIGRGGAAMRRGRARARNMMLPVWIKPFCAAVYRCIGKAPL